MADEIGDEAGIEFVHRLLATATSAPYASPTNKAMRAKVAVGACGADSSTIRP
jgi:hypothetical protein